MSGMSGMSRGSRALCVPRVSRVSRVSVRSPGRLASRRPGAAGGGKPAINGAGVLASGMAWPGVASLRAAASSAALSIPADSPAGWSISAGRVSPATAWPVVVLAAWGEAVDWAPAGGWAASLARLAKWRASCRCVSVLPSGLRGEEEEEEEGGAAALSMLFSALLCTLFSTWFSTLLSALFSAVPGAPDASLTGSVARGRSQSRSICEKRDPGSPLAVCGRWLALLAA